MSYNRGQFERGGSQGADGFMMEGDVCSERDCGTDGCDDVF